MQTLLYSWGIIQIMSLDEYLDPEPVCVEGIEPELALQRAYDADLMDKSECRQLTALKCISSGYFAFGGLFLSVFSPVTIALAAMFFGLGVIAEYKGTRGYENYAVLELEEKFRL